jgi:hypothetical protein
LKRIALFAAALAALITAATALAGGGTGITATPASVKTFDGGNTSAKFVRSASGIVNETNRIGLNGTTQNPWSPYDVTLQFRPLTGPGGTGSPTPSAACEGPTVIAPFTFTNGDPGIGGTTGSGYFIGSNPYNVCVYYASPFVLTLRVDGGTSLTTTVGHRITYSGHYSNGSVNIGNSTVTLDVFTEEDCKTANSLYTGISAGSTDASGNYSFLAGPSPLGTYSVIGHTTSPLGTVTSNCTNVVVQEQAEQLVASGSVNASSESGVSAIATLAGNYRIDVNGTWDNTSHGLVDAEYDNGGTGHTPADFSPLTYQDGWSGLGADWGDLLVDGASVDWGAYNDAHAYSYTLSGVSAGSSIALRVFDGDASGGSLVDSPGWYGDNAGGLNYTITYIGS